MKQRNIAPFLIEVTMCDPIQQTNSVTWSLNILCDAVGVSLLIPMNSCDHKVLLISHDLQTLMVFLAPSSPASFWFWLSCPFRFELKKPSQEQFHWPLWALLLYGLNWGCIRAELSFVLLELGSLEKQSAQASFIWGLQWALGKLKSITLLQAQIYSFDWKEWYSNRCRFELGSKWSFNLIYANLRLIVDLSESWEGL